MFLKYLFPLWIHIAVCKSSRASKGSSGHIVLERAPTRPKEIYKGEEEEGQRSNEKGEEKGRRPQESHGAKARKVSVNKNKFQMN